MKKKTKSHNKQKLLIALKMLACSQARMSPLPPPPPPPSHLLQFGTTKRNRENKRTPETSKHRKTRKKRKRKWVVS
jgi:hypothetical protein